MSLKKEQTSETVQDLGSSLRRLLSPEAEVRGSGGEGRTTTELLERSETDRGEAVGVCFSGVTEETEAFG